MLEHPPLNDTPSTSDNKNDETIIDQQTSLWGASSGIEWQGKTIVYCIFIRY